MAYLLAALAAPAVGALLYRWLHGKPQAVRYVDSFVYVAVPLLVAWQVLPHAWSERSVLPLAAVALGAGLPSLFERASSALADRADDLAIVVGVSGLVLHALLEGAGFAPSTGGVSVPFAGAVILHRVPVGLVVWWLIRPRHGIPAAAAAVGALVVATVVGYAVGSGLPAGAHGEGFELFQAFVAGSLFHVVFHQGRHDHQHDDGSAHTH